MSLIIGEDIGHAYGAQEVLKGLSFRIGPSDRIGLVGPNGEGKTTLLRIIGGLLDSTGGQIHHSRGLRIGYLPQTPPTMDGGTVDWGGAVLSALAATAALADGSQMVAPTGSEAGSSRQLMAASCVAVRLSTPVSRSASRSPGRIM